MKRQRAPGAVFHAFTAHDAFVLIYDRRVITFLRQCVRGADPHRGAGMILRASFFNDDAFRVFGLDADGFYIGHKMIPFGE